MTEETSKRLKDSDWIVVVALWERGEVTLSDLSDKFGVSKAALSQGLKRRGVVRGSKAHIATKKIQEKIESEKEKLVEDIYNFKKRFIGYGNYLADMAVTTLKEAKASGVTGAVAATRGELEAIYAATKTFAKIRDDMYHLYDMYDKDSAPSENYDFNIGVYSEKDIEAVREAQDYLKELEEENNKEHDEDDIIMEGLDEPEDEE